ncbi:MAG: acetyl-CoA carboxylase [Tepidiforma sp.]|nr:MAG: acetyl-CoA carboxylase [Tepidiforma sp.]
MKGLKALLRRGDGALQPEPERQPERCLSCGANLEGSRLYERFRVCHACGFHFHLTAQERVATLVDLGTFHEQDRGVSAIDPLSFPGSGRASYRSRVVQEQRRTRLTEAVVTGRGAIGGHDVVLGVVDFAFLGGSIGVAAGERLARAFERARARKLPVVLVCSTSGTRMQEGLLALMQGPRIAVAAERHAREGLPYICVLTDPTTGSAYSGFINLADVLIAEPNALVGYAALRALEASAKNGLPEGAHTSEAHLRHGLIDAVVSRPQLRDTLAGLLDLLDRHSPVNGLSAGRPGHVHHTPRPAWQQVQLSRHENRPTSREFIQRMTTAFFELRGDRSGIDDPTVVAGIGAIDGEAAVFIGQVRPHVGEHNGVIGPAGFRKAARAIRLGSRLGLPVVTLVDTAGADPSLAAEEAGQGSAIARCMAEMLAAASPTISVIIGEGNSEAAMAMAAADRVLMLDNAVYEVVRPEDAAAVLEGGPAEVAERLRLTSHDCLRLGIVDHTVAEPGEGAHTDHAEAAALLRRALVRELGRLRRMRQRRRLEARYARYREMGSTRSWLRGRLERRWAHLQDRVGGAFERLRGRAFGRRPDFPEDSGIPV